MVSTSEVPSLVRFVITDRGYEELLDTAREAAGLPADTPLMPSHGVPFSVRLEPCDEDEDPVFVRGVILPESMSRSMGANDGS